jgi:beta-lactamase class D
MIESDSAGVILREKTGWGDQSDSSVGWYVGYVENGTGLYYFANCIIAEGEPGPKFATARKEIAYRILNKHNILFKP